MNCPSIRIEGAILSPDILVRLEDAPGQRPTDFGFNGGIKVKMVTKKETECPRKNIRKKWKI
jgi:hypothetical protein